MTSRFQDTNPSHSKTEGKKTMGKEKKRRGKEPMFWGEARIEIDTLYVGIKRKITTNLTGQ